MIQSRTWLARVALALVIPLLAGCDLNQQESVKIANQGVRALNAGEIETALGLLKRALRKNPKNANAANLMGQIYFHDLRDHEEAMKAFRVVLESNPDHLDTHYQIGWLRFEQEKLEEAEVHLRKCLSMDPEHGNCSYFLGCIEHQKANRKRANDLYRAAIRMEPRKVRSFLALADLYQEAGATEEARAVLEEGIRLNPDSGSARMTLGQLLMERGEPSKAAQLFLEATQLAPDEHELLFAVGAAYVQSQDKKSAQHFLSRYLAAPRDGRQLERPNKVVAEILLENLRKGPRYVRPVIKGEDAK